MELFKLFGSIFIDNEEANKSITKTEKNAESLGSKLGNGIKTAAKWGASIVTGAAAAGTAVFKLASEASETASRINDLSEKIGISKTAFQEWDYITSQVGANVEGLQMGVKTLSNAAYEAAQGTASYAEAFDALGLSVTNADGSLKDQETLLNETIAALSKIEDKTTRTALATDLLGRSATDLAPLLNMDASEIENMRQKAHDLGIVLSDESVAAGDDFGDALDTLKATASSLLTSALAPLLPILTSLIQNLIEILPPIMAIIQPLIEKLLPVVQRLIDALLPVFLKLLDAFMPLLDPLIDLFLLLVDEALMPLIDFLIQITEALMPVFIELLEALMPVLKPILLLFGELLKEIMPLLVDIFTWISENVIPIFVKAIEAITPVVEKVGKVIGDIFRGIRDSIKSIVNFVIDGINVLIRGLNKLNIKVPDWVASLVGVEKGSSFGFSIKEIPKLAEGGDIIRGGAAIVGERGPELLNIPSGASVMPLQEKEFTLYNYMVWDGKIVANSTSRVQSQRNNAKSRALGAVRTA